MYKFLSFITAFFVACSTVLPVSFAATSNVIQIEITGPTTARVGEAIDVTLRAVDKDNRTVSSYLGSVIFSPENSGDIVPSPGKAISFTANDKWEKKFSKGVIFKKSGKQKIEVYSLSDDEVQWELTVMVEPESTVSTNNADNTITLITPENWSKITADSVIISGKTRKNSKVNIKLNGQLMGSSVLSDDIGIFNKTINGITQESNIITAELIDGTDKVLATSQEVKFDRMTSNIATYAVTINPSSTVEASSPIELVVDATPGLSELSVSIDGSLLTAKEWASGKYTIATIAPQKAGVYKLPITQKDALGQVKTTESSTTLTVTEKAVPVVDTVTAVPTFKNIKTVTKGSRIVFDFWVENAPTDLATFKIVYGQNADSLNQEVVTLPLARIPSLTIPGGYTWYIDKIPEGTYTFKIFGRTGSGALVSLLVSEPIVATIGKEWCTIGNVGNLTVNTDSSKSVISWEALSGATSYNLYKVSPAGDYSLFQNTTTNSYTLYLSKWAEVYENFVVKAKCDGTTESKEYSSMSRVQSWPGKVTYITNST